MQWKMVLRVLDKTGERVQDMTMLYKAVVQTVILYGSENRVLTGEMMKMLEDFHHRIKRSLTSNMDGA